MFDCYNLSTCCNSVFDVSRPAPGHQDRTITYSQTTHQIYGDIVVRFCVASLQNIIYNDPSEDLTAGNKIQASIFTFPGLIVIEIEDPLSITLEH